ncbi:MAG: DNA polymerase III subunit beta, partial [Gammaproteobacteria bacterium]|nr:DNA polymerase III subunit beta [Gammaproteobacteria bacterium]NIR82190.1 DNA polymerase III subunit beta [Gammaproteobacteria bacterium]NIR90789.1 DNA polymerase III subunit beta [Gammaproteobacteria bacterium]NIU03340.1 DNA polymerase III subunit beta [Gammaproteobacteria bacterium]NIV50836.1 DNA polymerase III subunit beta [Gammaproteobacteria bacterium]
IRDGDLSVTATDMEVELVAHQSLEGGEAGEITVPARKLIDICRALPSDAGVDFTLQDGRVTLRSGRSRFTLSTLPASEYPSTEILKEGTRLRVERAALKRVLELTHFSMAHQDVRYYLNGLLLELSPERLRTVATDGHRLALAELEMATGVEGETRQFIVPRKGIAELLRLLGGGEETVEVAIGENAIQANLDDVRLTSKLIDGRFPDYTRVIPSAAQCDKHVGVDRELLRQSLARASILSNEKYRAVRLSLEAGRLRIVANNPEQEEAEDEVEVDYDGEALEIGFNVSYMLDALAALPSERAELYLSDPSSSCLIQPEGRADCRYVIMPMRL